MGWETGGVAGMARATTTQCEWNSSVVEQATGAFTVKSPWRSRRNQSSGSDTLAIRESSPCIGHQLRASHVTRVIWTLHLLVGSFHNCYFESKWGLKSQTHHAQSFWLWFYCLHAFYKPVKLGCEWKSCTSRGAKHLFMTTLFLACTILNSCLLLVLTTKHSP